MLESGLFFTLGFLFAALLALMVAPAIWRRAVLLTRHRIESSVPLTLNEIQADKDQLRAEFAMSTRRLEVSVEELKERAAEQLIEINRRRDEVLLLEKQQSDKESRIAELEGQSAELRSELQEREEKLAAANTSLIATETRLEEKALSLEEMSAKYRKIADDFDGQKIEIVARETRLENVNDDVREARKAVSERESELATLKGEYKTLERNLKAEKDKSEQLERKLDRLQTKLSDMEARVERRDADIARLRSSGGETGERVSELQNQLDTVISEKIGLEAEIAQNAQRMSALLNDASDENIENAIATFETEQRSLRSELAELKSERDQLKVELSAVQTASGEDWETERRENAIIRERINDLAAQVTAMTASIEGPDSPVNEALKKAPAKKRTTKPGTRSKADEAADNVDSLADRIKALQAEAERA
ncbi:MAG: hypothetical protein AAGF28_09750 [Pseudomonadota bacterium]